MRGIEEELAACEVLSIDILDTLLFRLAGEAREVFFRVGERARESGLLPVQWDPARFRDARVAAQREARELAWRRDRVREVMIDGIYDLLPFDAERRRSLVELEISEETRACCLNPEVASWIRAAVAQGKPVVLASDMYLGSDRLLAILEANGASRAWFAEAYVSCECGGDKASGKVFERLLSRFPGTRPERILHVGDNEEADELAARKAGLRAWRYEVLSPYLSKVYEYERITRLAEPDRLGFLRALAARSAGGGFFGTFGASLLGPAVIRFCEWTLDRCEAAGVDRLCPFMREADVLAPVLWAAAEARGLSLRIEPLYVSRASTWLASLTDWDEEAVEDLLDVTGQTVGGALRYLGIAASELDFDGAGSGGLRGESNMRARQAVKRGLLSPDMIVRLRRLIEARREALLGYLGQAFGAASRIGTLDIGFRGTIAGNVEKALSIRRQPVELTHYLMFGVEELSRLREEGVQIEAAFSGPTRNQGIGRSVRRASFFVEQLLTGSGGSCVGYESSGADLWAPVLGPSVEDVYTVEAKAAVGRGIAQFQGLWNGLRITKAERLQVREKDLDQSAASIHRVIAFPVIEEARSLGRLSHDLNGGVAESRRVIREADRELLQGARSTDSFLKEARARGVHWPEGVVAERDEQSLTRRALQAADSEDGYLAVLYSLCQDAKRKGFASVVIYGAGDAGLTLARAARLAELTPLCFVDRKRSLWGAKRSGLIVLSLDEALERHPGAPFLVGSFAFTEEIVRTIRDRSEDAVVFTARKRVDS